MRHLLALALAALALARPSAASLYTDYLRASPEQRRAWMLDAAMRERMAKDGTPPAGADEAPVPRWIRAPGARNCRDIGGWHGLDGRRVRFGRIFRSTHLGRVKDAAAFLHECPVKTDLDLRKGEDIEKLGGRSPLGDSVRLCNAPMPAYGGYDSAKTRERFAKVFRPLLEGTNYPVIVHCAKGADRTGCVVLILNGLLGVSREDLVLDWELTAFFNPNPQFRHAERIDRLLATLDQEPGATMAEKCAAYVRGCGFTDADIAAFRAFMLEDAPAAPTVTAPAVPAWQVEGLLPAATAVFASREEEAAAIARAVAPIAAEPEPDAKIVYVDGAPKISLNGRLVEPVFNQSGDKIAYALNGAIKMASLGIGIHQIALPCRDFEKAAGVYDFTEVGRRIGRFLVKVPDARLLLAFHLEMPKWLKEHPEERVGYATGEVDEPKGCDELRARVSRPSVASRPYRDEVCRFLAQLGAYVRSQPWGRRVIALRPCWGIYTEWHMYGMYEAADVGPAMTAAFRRWKGGLYAEAAPPTAEERVRPGHSVLDPVRDRKLIDYYDCMANEVADCLLEFAAAAKRAMPGRLVGAYYGYVLAVHPSEGANVMLDKVLSSPAIDFLSDPAMYNVTTRRAGGAYYHRTIPATFHRYGKLSVLEDDMRFHHLNGFLRRNQDICTADPRESRMTMRRDWLNTFFDGCGIQFLDPSLSKKRPFSFDTPVVWQAMDESRRALAAAGPRGADSGNDVAVVVDWRERLRRPSSAGFPRGSNTPYAEVPPWIYASGAAVDFMTLDDFLAQPERRYSKAVFLNLFTTDAELAARLAARTARKGFRAVFMRNAPQGCQGPDGTTLAEIPRGAKAWRLLFADLGTPLYAPEGHCVRRHGDIVMFHTGKVGTHEICFPGRAGATELFSGKVYAGDRAIIETDGPDTLLFKMKP